MYCTVYTHECIHENRLKRAKPCVLVSEYVCMCVAMFVFISAEMKKMKKMS